MAGSSFDRRDYKTAIPQLSATMNDILDNNVKIEKRVIVLNTTVEDNEKEFEYYKNLTTGYFTAIVGDLDYLTSRKAYIAKLSSDILEIGFLTAESAEIENLKVGELEIDGVTVNVYDIATGADSKADQAILDAGRAADAATNAEASAAQSAESARSASQSASSAGENASRAQAAADAAQQAALSTLTTDTLHYLATSQGSGVTTQTSGWTTTVQTMSATNKYLWTYHTYKTADGTTTDTTPIITGTYGEKGADGTSVTILGSYNTLAELQAAHPTGALGDSYIVGGDLYVWNGSAWENAGQIQGPKGDTGATGPQGAQGPQGLKGDKGDSPTITTTKNGKTTTILADGVSIGTVLDGNNGTSPTVSKSGDTVTITDGSGTSVTIKDGEDGQSIKGDDGDDAYIHIAWANSSDGTSGFSTVDAAGKLYMGTYTDHVQADSQTPSNYKWVKIKGEQGIQGIQGKQGVQGIQGIQGIQGEQGDTGISITAVQPQYYISISQSQTQGGSWQTSLAYVVGKFIWTRDRITYSDNSIGYSDEIYNEALTRACKDAAEALGIIEEQQEYFWHDSLGAHVLSDTDDVTGVRYRTDIKGAGQEVYKINSDGTENSVSKFGETIRIGVESGSHLMLDGDSIDFHDGITQIGYVGTDSARFPIMHVSSRMSVGNKYEWRITPSGSLGLYLM